MCRFLVIVFVVTSASVCHAVGYIEGTVHEHIGDLQPPRRPGALKEQPSANVVVYAIPGEDLVAPVTLGQLLKILRRANAYAITDRNGYYSIPVLPNATYSVIGVIGLNHYRSANRAGFVKDGSRKVVNFSIDRTTH